jgi:hypothetical protein
MPFHPYLLYIVFNSNTEVTIHASASQPPSRNAPILLFHNVNVFELSALNRRCMHPSLLAKFERNKGKLLLQWLQS